MQINSVSIPVSIGEVLDKITILELKLEHITDPAKLENVKAELKMIEGAIDQHLIFESAHVQQLYDQLYTVNSDLWEIEDALRQHEADEDFEGLFTERARRVYFLNDERSEIKREINLSFGSKIIEEKSYEGNK